MTTPDASWAYVLLIAAALTAAPLALLVLLTYLDRRIQ